MKDSFRSGTSDTALCQCGKAEESVEHFLLHCENYEKDKKVMMDNVLDIVDSGKSKRSLRITDELLLAPAFDDISKRKMLFIKEYCLSSLQGVIGIYNTITSGVYKAATYFVEFYIGFYLSFTMDFIWSSYIVATVRVKAVQEQQQQQQQSLS